MLILHVTQALENTASDGVAEILSGGLGMDVAKVDGAVETLSAGKALKGVGGGEGHVGSQGRCSEVAGVGVDRSESSGRLSNERLRRGSLSGLSSSLLRLRDVRATVLTVVDTLALPCWLGRKGVDNLKSVRQ